MRVLITNIELWSRTGTPLYVLDLARELRRQGHIPAVYTFGKGALARVLEEDGITVTENLRTLPFSPDIIHGHHFSPTMSALAHFPRVPAIFVCHHHAGVDDLTPRHPRVRRYFGVSRVCVERVRREHGAEAAEVGLLLNFVDTKRFRPRLPLPDRPTRALVFSNYANSRTHLPSVTEACRRAGIALETVGGGVSNQSARPEEILGNYDLVFAKAKAAMEAIAVGSAAILCDFSGSGPLVSTDNFAVLRTMNFGFESLCAPLEPESLLTQIARYDPRDATVVSNRIRNEANLEIWTRELVQTYQQAVEEQRALPADFTEELRPSLQSRKRFLVKLGQRIGELGPRPRTLLKRLPAFKLFRDAFIKAYRP